MLSSGATWVQTKTHISLGEETTRTLAPLLKVSRRSGAPISHIIEREIRVLNDRRLAEAKTKLSEASVKLSLPMGLAMLPALVFLVVIPVFITMSSSPSQMALQS
jgi:Flp pilus assembly protein TadB